MHLWLVIERPPGPGEGGGDCCSCGSCGQQEQEPGGLLSMRHYAGMDARPLA